MLSASFPKPTKISICSCRKKHEQHYRYRVDEPTSGYVIIRIKSSESYTFPCRTSPYQSNLNPHAKNNLKLSTTFPSNRNHFFLSIVLASLSLHIFTIACPSTPAPGKRKTVPPRWIVEPTDVSVERNRHITLHCQAQGVPTPTILWKKATGGYLSLLG